MLMGCLSGLFFTPLTLLRLNFDFTYFKLRLCRR